MGWKDTKAGLVCQVDFIAVCCIEIGGDYYPEANSHPRCCNPDLKTVYESSISLPANRHKETLNRDKGFMIKCNRKTGIPTQTKIAELGLEEEMNLV